MAPCLVDNYVNSSPGTAIRYRKRAAGYGFIP